jgi:hypothetical protein
MLKLVADLEGGGVSRPLRPFVQNLPSNVSKTQNCRPQIHEYIAILGNRPRPLSSALPPFRNFWIRHWIQHPFNIVCLLGVNELSGSRFSSKSSNIAFALSKPYICVQYYVIQV